MENEPLGPQPKGEDALRLKAFISSSEQKWATAHKMLFEGRNMEARMEMLSLLKRSLHQVVRRTCEEIIDENHALWMTAITDGRSSKKVLNKSQQEALKRRKYMPLTTRTTILDGPKKENGEMLFGCTRFESEGIFYRVATDVNLGSGNYLYSSRLWKGNLELGAKAAGNELRSTNALYEYFLGGEIDIQIPWQVVVDYRGYRILACPVLPTHAAILVYGSADCGYSVCNSDPLLSTHMERAAEFYSIAPHKVRDVTLVSGGDVEGYKVQAESGIHNYYVMDLARYLPCECPEVTAHLPEEKTSVFYRMLRPEFLYREMPKARLKPISPDSGSKWGHFQDASLNENWKNATKYLCGEIVGNICAKLISEAQKFCPGHANATPPAGLEDIRIPKFPDTINIGAICHQMGLPLRHLGLLFQIMKEDTIKLADYALRSKQDSTMAIAAAKDGKMIKMKNKASSSSARISTTQRQLSILKILRSRIVAEMISRSLKHIIRRGLRMWRLFEVDTEIKRLLNQITFNHLEEAETKANHSGCKKESLLLWNKKVPFEMKQCFGFDFVKTLTEMTSGVETTADRKGGTNRHIASTPSYYTLENKCVHHLICGMRFRSSFLAEWQFKPDEHMMRKIASSMLVITDKDLEGGGGGGFPHELLPKAERMSLERRADLLSRCVPSSQLKGVQSAEDLVDAARQRSWQIDLLRFCEFDEEGFFNFSYYFGNQEWVAQWGDDDDYGDSGITRRLRPQKDDDHDHILYSARLLQLHARRHIGIILSDALDAAGILVSEERCWEELLWWSRGCSFERYSIPEEKKLADEEDEGEKNYKNEEIKKSSSSPVVFKLMGGKCKFMGMMNWATFGAAINGAHRQIPDAPVNVPTLPKTPTDVSCRRSLQGDNDNSDDDTGDSRCTNDGEQKHHQRLPRPSLHRGIPTIPARDQMPHKRRRKSLESKRVIIDWVKVRDFLTECKICAAAASRSGQAPIEGATAIAFQAIDALYRFTTSAPWTNTILENHAAKVAGLYKALIGFEQTYQNKLGSSSSSKSSRKSTSSSLLSSSPRSTVLERSCVKAVRMLVLKIWNRTISDRSLLVFPPMKFIPREGTEILGEWVGELVNLKSLVADSHKLQHFPSKICDNLKRLESLSLKSNGLSSLPRTIGGLHSLEKLFLNKNKLCTIPVEILKLKRLRRLDLSRNKITSLPDELGGCTALEHLDISENVLVSLPKLGSLTALQSLRVSHNSLKSLPPDIANLSSLYSMEISNNDLESLPCGIWRTPLPQLILTDNPNISSLPEIKAQNTHLATLRVCVSLERLPDSIYNLVALKHFDVSWNKLGSLPDGIGGLARLQTLNLTSNNLHSLPTTVGDCLSLQRLYVTRNVLKSLPDSIGKLKSLVNLNLKNNNLTSLPEAISRVRNLQTLVGSNNRLKSIPEKMGGLKNLQVLQLNSNDLCSIPDSLGVLSDLKKLDLSSNMLKSLPKELGKLVALKSLKYQGNRLWEWRLPKEVKALLQMIKANSQEDEEIDVHQITKGQENNPKTKICSLQ